MMAGRLEVSCQVELTSRRKANWVRLETKVNYHANQACSRSKGASIFPNKSRQASFVEGAMVLPVAPEWFMY